MSLKGENQTKTLNDNLRAKIRATKAGVTLLLAITVYTGTWGVVEPLNLTWINDHIILWRTILIAWSLLAGFFLSFPLTGRSLQTIDANGRDVMLQNSYRSGGTPTVTIEADGNFGNVAVIKADYNKDELDWDVRPTAQKAGKLEFIFRHRGIVHFYLRVVVVSKTGDVSVPKWIKFDNSHAVPDRYEGQEEMAIPYESINTKNFQKVTIDIEKAVKETFGQGGWEYGKVLAFRVRGNVTIRHVIFKK